MGGFVSEVIVDVLGLPAELKNKLAVLCWCFDAERGHEAAALRRMQEATCEVCEA